MASAWDMLGVGDRAKAMLLGTFHLSAYPEEMLSPKRQEEIEEVVACLARFQPTKITVEARWEDEARINQRYRDYLAGNFELIANETYQFGFRLAARLGHERLYAVDEWGRFYDGWEHVFAYAAQQRGLSAEGMSEAELEGLWIDLQGRSRVESYRRLYQHDETLRQAQTLREHLRYMNSEERILAGHGNYLLYPKQVSPGDYTLEDHITGWWFNRNLRIFANISRVTTSASDRILSIYGAGHLAILRHCLQSSSEHQLVEVAEYL